MPRLLGKVAAPRAAGYLLEVNLTNHVFSQAGISTVSDYVSQTIIGACINIICFLLCFIVLSWWSPSC